MSGYVPSPATIDRLLASWEEQGLDPKPSEESLAFVASILRAHFEGRARARQERAA